MQMYVTFAGLGGILCISRNFEVYISGTKIVLALSNMTSVIKAIIHTHAKVSRLWYRLGF